MKNHISFIFPVYNERDGLPELWGKMQPVFESVSKKYDYEVIFVNDGSRDGSFEKLTELYKSNPEHVKVIHFSRNYGHQIAVTAGQDIAQGDAVIIMDSDLQDPPEVALKLIGKWEQGADIVYAKRRSYKTHPVKKFFGWAFYRILRSIAQVEIPVDTGDFRLLSKKVNSEMKKYKEKSRYLRGMTSLMGFQSDFVEFDRGERFAGKTHYPFKKSVKLALDAITGYSTFPLKFISRLGTWMSLFAFLGGGVYILYTFFTQTQVSGWLSLMAALVFFFGVTMLMIGILGEYIGRIYTEVLDRPLYTVDMYLGSPVDTVNTIQRN